jgi:hypothetical protein
MQVGAITLYAAGTTPLIYNALIDFPAMTSIDNFDIHGHPLIKENGVLVTNDDSLAKNIELHSSTAFKYEVTIACTDNNQNFIAKINWDKGTPYYKLVQCSAQELHFVETGKIPTGASKGVLYLSARAENKITVKSISVGGR